MVGNSISHYRVVAKLGEGGMGVVYKAEDTTLGRDVALKFLSQEVARNCVTLQRFQREARTASTLNHPNICTVYEVGEGGGQNFIAMEYVEGRSLSALIPAEGLRENQVLRYGKQIAEALAHSHDRGVVHRDLKSSNVMVTPEGRIKVLDFGLAKRLAKTAGEEEATRTEEDTLTRDGSIVGTLAYMSPEALRGELVDARGDVWSFGVLLYEMVAGRLPFQGKNLLDVSAAVLRAPMPELPAAAGAGLRAVIERCLAKEPAQRYQRGAELRAALEALESASRAPAGAPAGVLSRRRWLWTTGAAAATMGVAGGIFWRARYRTYAPRPSKVAEANEYLRRAMLFVTTQMDMPRARQFLEKAIELDPKFAYARAWYGFSYLMLLDFGDTNDFGLLYKAEEELRRALRDDPHSAKAHASLSMVYFYRGRKDLAMEEVRTAIKTDPNDRELYVGLANYHQFNGEYQQSEALFRKILDSDPLFFPARAFLGEVQRGKGDARASAREQEKVLEQDGRNLLAFVFLAGAHMTLGDLPKARQVVERARSLYPRNYNVRIVWALQLALEGKRAEALREMDADVLKYGELIGRAAWVAESYAVLGEKAAALDWLDRAVRGGDERAEWFQRDPLLATIRDEPRFRQILESILYRREQRAR